MFVGIGVSDKIEQIHHRIYSMRAGTSSHSKALAHMVRTYTDMQATELGNLPPVKSVASVARKIVYENRPGLNCAMILAGWDPYSGYQVYHVN